MYSSKIFISEVCTSRPVTALDVDVFMSLVSEAVRLKTFIRETTMAAELA